VLFLRQLYLAHVLNFVIEFFHHGLLLLLLDTLLTPPANLSHTDHSRNNPQYDDSFPPLDCNDFLRLPDVTVTSHPRLNGYR